MSVSIETRMEKAIAFFTEQGSHCKHEHERELYEHMHEIAAANLLNTRMLEVLKHELEAVRDELRSH